VIQTLFFFLDPFSAERKFRRFAALDPASDEARRFVALEDWITTACPWPSGGARLWAFLYHDNEPARGLWRVAGDPVRHSCSSGLPSPWCPVETILFLQVPPNLWPPRWHGDRPAPPLGHIGMMSALRAPRNAVDADRSLAAGTAGRSKGALILSAWRSARDVFPCLINQPLNIFSNSAQQAS